MSIPGSASPLFFQTAAGAGAAAGPIKSVRFNDDDSAYLDRTPSSAGNRKKWTWSGWVKKCKNGATQCLFYGGTSNNNLTRIIHGPDSLELQHFDNGSFTGRLETNANYKDPSAWYHFVVAVDTTQGTASNRIKLYVNGVLQDSFLAANYPSQNLDLHINNTNKHSIAVEDAPGGAKSYYFDGYMADVYHIDGQQLDCTSFGAFDSNGVWQAAAYSGSFGTNGFHLFDFANESGIGNDSSGNDNDFTVNNLTSEGGSTVRTTELSENHPSGSYAFAEYAFDAAYISGKINTSTFAVTTTAWQGAYNAGYGSFRWIPVGGYAVSSSLRVYFGAYSNAAASTTLTVTYTDSSTESSSQFTSGNNNWMTLFTASNAAGKTIQKVEITNPNNTNIQFGGFVVDDQIVESANAGTDVLRDVPTNGDSSDDTGAGGEVSGNYCTWSPLAGTNVTLSNGNLDCSLSAGTASKARTTIAVTSGKYYWEIKFKSGNYGMIGISDASLGGSQISYAAGALNYYVQNGTLYGDVGGSFSGTSYGSALSANDVLGVALDMDNGNVKFYKNGSDLGNANTTSLVGKTIMPHLGEAGGATFVTEANFGQRAFAYSAPSGYKALCTTNLPTPTIADGSTAFDIVLYTSDSNSRTISGLNMSPDLVWSKRRSAAGRHVITDSVRGVNKELYPDRTAAERTSTDGLTQFNSDGYVIGDDDGEYGWQANGATFVNWAWDAGSSTASNTDGSITSSVRVNQTSGFSIISYTGNGSSSGSTVGHGLGTVPDLLVVKSRGTSYSWNVWHNSFTAKQLIYLNHNYAIQDNKDDHWNNTLPTNSVFSLRESPAVNNNGTGYICYAFSMIPGYSAFGKYSGNSLPTEGNFIYLPFRPAFLLIKDITSTGYWYLTDSGRNPTNDGTTNYVWANTTGSEQSDYVVDLLSNGFRLLASSGNLNASGREYIYAAFAENPFQANGGLAR